MSYFERLQKEYGEMGNAGIRNTLDEAQSKAQEKLTADSEDRQGITGKVEGELGKLVGEKIGGKYVMGKLIGGAKKFIAEPRRKALKKQADTKLEGAETKRGEISDLKATGQGRIDQGFNADGSLKAGGKSAREGMPDDIKFREGDITPEDLAGGDNSALTASNKSRYRALDDEGQSSVKDKLTNNDNYTTKTQTDADVSSGTITPEEGMFQRNRSKFIEQDAIGDAEASATTGGTASTTLTGANPYSGTNLGGTAGTPGGNPITGKMSDRPDGEMFDRTTGLNAGESGRVVQTTAEADALEGGAAELGSATALEMGLEAIPVIGEIAGLGLGLGEGIKDAIKSHKEQLTDTANMVADNANINTAMKYSGFSRPSFGSMALPSFDTSKSSALLQE